MSTFGMPEKQTSQRAGSSHIILTLEAGKAKHSAEICSDGLVTPGSQMPTKMTCVCFL